MNQYKTLFHVRIKLLFFSFEIKFKTFVGQFELPCILVGISV